MLGIPRANFEHEIRRRVLIVPRDTTTSGKKLLRGILAGHTHTNANANAHSRAFANARGRHRHKNARVIYMYERRLRNLHR